MTNQGNYGAMSSLDESSGSGSENEKPTFADLGVRREAKIVETLFGKRRPLSKVRRKEWLFLALVVASLLGATGLTIQRMASVSPNSSDFTFALVLLVTIIFCLLYVLNGIFGERPYELLIFVVGTVLMMTYCIVNYVETVSMDPDIQNNCTTTNRVTEKKIKLARLILVSVAGPINIGLGLYIAREFYLSRNLIFRTVGANPELQDPCSRMFLAESLLKIDLHLEITLVILILNSTVSAFTVLEKVVLGVGMVYAVVWVAIGFLSIRFENKPLVVVLLALSWCEPAYIIYRMVDVGKKMNVPCDHHLIPAAIIIAGISGLVVRVILCCFMVYIYRNFGRGMREKAYYTGKKMVATQGDSDPESS